jgi:ribonuclease HI
MHVPTPHYLLFSESRREQEKGAWRFVLQSLAGESLLEAEAEECEVQGERLELLAVVRGLEALDHPARVTLVTPSRYVDRGMRYGLEDWRSNGWQWERYGAMVPVKNRDLWQRVDRALKFHQVECCTWRFDESHGAANAADSESTTVTADADRPPTGREPQKLRNGLMRGWTVCQRWAGRRAESGRLWMAQLGTRFMPQPWLD